ncbi:MAG: FAD-dependent oxidoreductase [Bacteroidota bacterium]
MHPNYAMSQNGKVSIIGGGVIGLCCAYYLRRAGREVEIFDKGKMEQGCSYGNAGMIVPSHFIPLAAPGMITKGIKWMFDPRSPFYIKARLNWDLLTWGWKFYRASNQKQVQKSMPVLRDISLLSKALYRDLARLPDFQFAFEEKGLLMLYKSQEAEAEEREMAHQAQQLGLEAVVYDAEDLQKMEPDVQLNVRGGVHYPGDAHLAPELFLTSLKKHLQGRGVPFHAAHEIVGFHQHRGKIEAIETQHGRSKVDHLLIAGGTWSGQLVRQLKINLPLQAGKGYSITLKKPAKQLRYPAILTEAKVAVTPMNAQLRFGGTMEIGGINHRINPKRVQGILQSIPQYLPDFQPSMPENDQIWHGLRPCSPDGLPYIGKSQRFSNLSIATGHAMMGLSLAPATGKLIAELLTDHALSMELNALAPERYG